MLACVMVFIEKSALETGRKASMWWDFVACFAARANTFYIFQQHLSSIVKKSNNNFLKRAETSIVVIVFKGIVYPTYTVIISYHSFYINQVPKKLYFCQWLSLYNNNISSQCNDTVQKV